MCDALHTLENAHAYMYEAGEVGTAFGLQYIHGALQKIAARTVGAGNVCYLSVYNSMNDTIPLKKGQKIYIPKLVLKSKVSK